MYLFIYLSIYSFIIIYIYIYLGTGAFFECHTLVLYIFFCSIHMCTHIDACSNITNHAQTRVHTDTHTHTHSRTHTHIHKHVGNQNMTMILQKNDLIELIFDIHIYIYTHVWVALRLMLQDYGCPIDAS